MEGMGIGSHPGSTYGQVKIEMLCLERFEWMDSIDAGARYANGGRLYGGWWHAPATARQQSGEISFISEFFQYLWNGFNLPIFRLRLGMTRTFRLCTCVKDFKCWSRKSVIYQLFVQSVKRLRLNFSLEKSSSEPFLYRFSLQLLSWYMIVPNLWTDSLVEFPWNCLNFFGILQVEYSVICC